MKTYIVLVEGITQRVITVNAHNKTEADKLAIKDFCLAVGSDKELITKCEAIDSVRCLHISENKVD